jgi:hypothetical protein
MKRSSRRVEYEKKKKKKSNKKTVDCVKSMSQVSDVSHWERLPPELIELITEWLLRTFLNWRDVINLFATSLSLYASGMRIRPQMEEIEKKCRVRNAALFYTTLHSEYVRNMERMQFADRLQAGIDSIIKWMKMRFEEGISGK